MPIRIGGKESFDGHGHSPLPILRWKAAFLVFDPTAEFNADIVEEFANILIAFAFHQLKIEQEAGLVPQQIEPDVEFFESFEFVVAVAGKD